MRLRREEFLRPQYFSRLAVTFALCFIAGKLGLSVAFTSGNVSPVWPSSGIAVAAVLLWGYRMWPGVAMASFLVNLLSPIPALAAPIIALGSTSSALVGAYLLYQFAGFQPSLTRLRDALGLVMLPAFVSTTLAASMGITGLFVAHVKPWSGFGSAWLVWWLGDAMGVLIVTPLVLTGGELVKTPRGYRWLELGSLASAIAAPVESSTAPFNIPISLAISDGQDTE